MMVFSSITFQVRKILIEGINGLEHVTVAITGNHQSILSFVNAISVQMTMVQVLQKDFYQEKAHNYGVLIEN